MVSIRRKVQQVRLLPQEIPRCTIIPKKYQTILYLACHSQDASVKPGAPFPPRAFTTSHSMPRCTIASPSIFRGETYRRSFSVRCFSLGNIYCRIYSSWLKVYLALIPRLTLSSAANLRRWILLLKLLRRQREHQLSGGTKRTRIRLTFTIVRRVEIPAVA